ncbi:hypothetical protein [Spirulina sp. 06S082]|uniref:hypothetical protein n=1 Tax=Spirulina sp. 06S082 TaxID=3110248 RepID=UPI002B217B9B|nr:hypothetical protein [Spirulina sp. 06S082]MEA5471144.1 hypothetical protein [Spirulina sp. 06S082]
METCSQPNCNNPVSKPGHTLCYNCWKTANAKPTIKTIISPKPKIVNSPMLLSATKISQKLNEQNYSVHRNNVNRILSELGLLEKKGTDWIATRRGIAFGATQKNDPKTGNSYVLWSPNILENRIFLEAIKNIISETTDSNILETKSEQSFREKFRESAKFRTTDGHWVRSKAEVMIDNWLYMAELVHAYERRLPIAEEVYCDFYIPSGKVYLEYWGYENDSKYLDRKREKQRIYQQYELNLIEIVDENVRDLDDFLPRILLTFGVQVS